MDPQAKRTLLATVLCLGILFAWLKYTELRHPSPALHPPVTTAPQAEIPTVAGPSPAPTVEAVFAEPEFVVEGGDDTATVVIGDDTHDKANPYRLEAEVSPEGAGVNAVRLAGHLNEVPKERKNPVFDPYELLHAIDAPGVGKLRSFVVEKIWLREEQQDIWLKDETWAVERTLDDRGQSARFSVDIQKGEERILRIVRTFRVEKGSYHLAMDLSVENFSPKPRQVVLTVRGPVGVKQEDIRWESRRVFSVLRDDAGELSVGIGATRADVYKAKDHRVELTYDPEDEHLYWAALGNKYFACIVAPQPLAGEDAAYPSYWSKLVARTFVDNKEYADDLTFEQSFTPGNAIPAGGAITLPIEAYCGPKSRKLFDGMAEARQRDYYLATQADGSMCTFEAVSNLMYWLLTKIERLVGNYGIAIFLLVILVRLVLHPVSKKGQLHMMKMQKNMQKLKPKLEALQQQYKNDKQKLSEETMKLYREEGVNPAGSMLGCLPMLLQMPIWVALYTTLNTNVEMRHEPFFGYIRDLSSPDALISFSRAYSIPLLSYLMGPLASLNVLPLLMAGVMYGQQKLTQKLTKPEQPPAPKLDAEGNPLPDTMAQQQKIMNFMMIFMGAMFYNFPSGLCLYILCSSLLGIGEQYYIRRHLKEIDKRLEAAKVRGSNHKPGRFSQFWDRMQARAEEARRVRSNRPEDRPARRRRK